MNWYDRKVSWDDMELKRSTSKVKAQIAKVFLQKKNVQYVKYNIADGRGSKREVVLHNPL